jgi:hypothetical protein
LEPLHVLSSQRQAPEFLALPSVVAHAAVAMHLVVLSEVVQLAPAWQYSPVRHKGPVAGVFEHMHKFFAVVIAAKPVRKPSHIGRALQRSDFVFVAASRHQLLPSQSGASLSVPHVHSSVFCATPSLAPHRLSPLPLPLLCAEHVPVAVSQLFVAPHLLVVAGSPVFVHQQMSSLSPSLHSAALSQRSLTFSEAISSPAHQLPVAQ